MKKVLPPTRSPGRPRGFDRDEALDCAMRLFWHRGFEATSISDLTKAMQITPPALYSAFGDKKRLFFEAVEKYELGPACFAQKALTEESTAEQAIHRLLLDAVDFFTDEKNPKGCLIVQGAMNCTADSADIAEALAERRRVAESFVFSRIETGRSAGEFSDTVDPKALTGMVVTTLYGLAIKSRDGEPRAQLRAIVAQFMSMWPR